MDYVIAMFEYRPYVVVLVFAFWIIAGAERGFRRAGIWFVTGTFIGWLVEFSSTRNGFPFGDYVYHEALFPEELWIGGVPLFASLSFACLTYLGYSIAYTLLSGMRLGERGLERIENREVAISIPVLLLATAIITWMDLVLDPVTHLGEYWGLGSLYHYDPPGIHFDVPLSNYAGWLFTSFSIVAVNQLIERFTIRSADEMRGAYRLPFQPLLCLIADFGQYLFMIAVLFYLMNSDEVPSDTPLVGILISTLFFAAGYVMGVGSLLVRALPSQSSRLEES